MSRWFPLHCHSMFSLLDGLSKPEQIASRLLECGYAGSALTDHGTVAGIPSFLTQMKSKSLKGIAGVEMYLCPQSATIKTADNARYSHLCLLAKGQAGWKRLVKIASASNHPSNFYYKPRLSLEELGQLTGSEFIAFSGHPGSDLANVCFHAPGQAYGARTYEEAKVWVAKDWQDRVYREICRYQQVFGKDNFFLEIQLIDRDHMPASAVVADMLRWAGRQWDVPRVATADSHYPRQEDSSDQRILLCTALNKPLKDVMQKIENDEDVSLSCFFRSRNYHIPSLEEMQALHTEDELENSVKIADQCSAPSLANQPFLPMFACPDGLSADEYFRVLCERGWNRKIASKVNAKKHAFYREELERQLKVLTEAGLSSYFLITQDFIRYAIDVLKCRVGEGRGSGAGCLPSYLTDITNIDPIKHDLLFERFYNAGRNTPGRIALPDIDSDFPAAARDKVIEYIRDKYGTDNVSQMATFSRMQGRGALSDVLRAHSRFDYAKIKTITEHIPDEAAIADELQEMAEAGEEPSIIRWSLENTPELLREWCFLTENDELDGPLSIEFAQAIRLEGTKRSQGRHASGVIISSVPLAEVAPMVYDKHTEQMIVGVDMRDAEVMGLVKFDILATAVLDKIQDVERLIRTGSF